MSYTLRKKEMPKNKYSIKCPYEMKPQGIVVHNTDNNAPASAEVNYMHSNNNQVSFHVCIDEKEVIECSPFNRCAWHCGNSKGNRTQIGIEIARNKHKDEKLFLQAEKNAAEYIASLLKKYGWGIDKVTQHANWAPKNCPSTTRKLGWQRFLNMIKKELKTTAKFKPYTIIVSSFDGELNIREKPDANSKKVGVLKNGKTKYTIVEEKNGFGKLKSGAGYICLKYCKKV